MEISENIQTKESSPDPKSLGTNSGTVGASREMLSMGSVSQEPSNSNTPNSTSAGTEAAIDYVARAAE